MAGLENEGLIRLSCFAGVLFICAVVEWLWPRRKRHASRRSRWTANLGLALINTFVARLLVPLGVVGVAVLAEQRGWGLLHQWEVPAWLAVLLAVIVLDLIIYVQHVLFHALPVLWRLHVIHHADVDVDATTGIRFHPVEMLLSLGIKAAGVMALGAPALAVLIFEVLLNASSMVNHSNVRWPAWLERALRLVIVTPDMHRIHHSVDPVETNSNFGFNLPWWDYLLGTYRAIPAKGHEKMDLGVAEVPTVRAEHLGWLLMLPLLPPAIPQPQQKTTAAS